MTEEERRNTVILVNEKDQETGTEEKLRAHQLGLLHRAFSVLIYNDKGEMMLQHRALKKYHSGGLWTVTCCGHQMLGEETDAAPHRRLFEEMGFDCDLTKQTTFIYNVPVPPDLIEHEFLHVYYGMFNDEPNLNPEEAMGYRWISKQDLEREIIDHPEHFTPWFLIIAKKGLMFPYDHS